MSLSVAVDARILDRDGMEQSGVGRYALEVTRAICRVRPDWRVRIHTQRAELFDGVGAEAAPTRWPTGNPLGRIAWIHAASALEVASHTDLLFGTAFVLPVWWRKPAVVTIHDLMFLLLREKYKGKLNARYASAATRRSAQKADYVICGTRETRARLVDAFALDPAKIRVTPYGVSRALRQSAAGGPPPAPEPPYLLFVGTFEARKGLATLREALRSPGFPPADLVLAGRPGWGVDEILADLRADHRVREVHNPSDEELAELYHGALAVVYPSEMEGFGLPVAEAMASGVPVIATGLDGIREFAADAPLYIAPGDHVALAAHVSALLSTPALAASHRALGLRAAEHLTWDAVGEQTAETIELAAQRHSRRSHLEG